MSLLERLTEALAPCKPKTQRMFSGTSFMLNGNLLVATTKQGILVRAGPAAEQQALASPHATAMEMRGRRMPGWIIVSPQGVTSQHQLDNWISMALAFNKTLPAKTPSVPRKKPKKK